MQVVVEYTQNHAMTATSQSLSERCECDVYFRLFVKWREPKCCVSLERSYE